MATKPKDSKEGQTTDLAEVKNSALAVVDNAMFAADAGAGLEGADKDSYAIPFLLILQKGSPQVDETHPAANVIEGAKAGGIFNNVTSEVFDGKKGITFLPCSFRRAFIRWGSETSGEGFKGEFTADQVEALRAKGEVRELDNRLYFAKEDGSVNENDCDRLSDTRNHYILIIDEETGDYKEALLSLSSTQIKKSKTLLSALANVKIKGAQGMFTPPTFANVVRLSTIPESNDKGSWYGVRLQIEGQVKNGNLYAAAKAFNEKVKVGAVTAKYEQAGAADVADEEAAAAKGF